MPNTQPATVGRIVNYWQHGREQPVPAIINSVATDDRVMLYIFWPGHEDPRPAGGYYQRSHAREDGCWSWPERGTASHSIAGVQSMSGPIMGGSVQVNNPQAQQVPVDGIIRQSGMYRLRGA